MKLITGFVCIAALYFLVSGVINMIKATNMPVSAGLGGYAKTMVALLRIIAGFLFFVWGIFMLRRKA